MGSAVCTSLLVTCHSPPCPPPPLRVPLLSVAAGTCCSTDPVTQTKCLLGAEPTPSFLFRLHRFIPAPSSGAKVVARTRGASTSQSESQAATHFKPAAAFLWRRHVARHQPAGEPLPARLRGAGARARQTCLERNLMDVLLFQACVVWQMLPCYSVSLSFFRGGGGGGLCASHIPKQKQINAFAVRFLFFKGLPKVAGWRGGGAFVY